MFYLVTRRRKTKIIWSFSFVQFEKTNYNCTQWHCSNYASSLISVENLSFFNGLYDKAWARLSPYIFGICIGYVIHKIETRLEISIGMMMCGEYELLLHALEKFHHTILHYSIEFAMTGFSFSGWTACTLLLIALIFSKSLITLTTNAIFSTIMHMTWSIIILWIIIASISKHRGTISFRMLQANLLNTKPLRSLFCVYCFH